MIVFAGGSLRGLKKVPASGGVPVPVASNPGSRYASFLPDGEHFVSWSQAVSAGEAGSGGIWLGSLDSSPPRFLLASSENGIYAAGHLVYLNENMLMAVPFDPDSQKILGQPVRVAERIPRSSLGTGPYSASENGTLAYVSGGSDPVSQMTWRNLQGEKVGTIGSHADHHVISISPDSKYVVSSVRDSKGNRDLWLYEIESRRRERLTTHQGNDVNTVWSPDLKSIVFNSNRKGVFLDLYMKQIGSFEEEKLLFESLEDKRPSAWSKDGKYLLFLSHHPKNSADIWILPMPSGSKATPFLVTEFDERTPQLSPNQQWVLYQQRKGGPSEVYAISFPDHLHPTRISKEGGSHGRWAPDGRKVYYLDSEDYIVSAEVRTEGTDLQVGSVERLFKIQPYTGQGGQGPPPFDIHPDGQRFLVNEAVENTNSVPATVVLNWTREFQKK